LDLRSSGSFRGTSKHSNTKLSHRENPKIYSTINTSIILAIICLGAVSNSLKPGRSAASKIADTIYQQRTVHNPDGIGKFYIGSCPSFDIKVLVGWKDPLGAWKRNRLISQQSLDLKPNRLL
jgi:hypothetical protein